MNTPLQAVGECREILRKFINGAFDYGAFRDKMARAMGPLDPLDWALEELDAESAIEAKMYSEWLGGEFGETEDRIPRKPDWRYGESDEPYGWVDQDEYRIRLHSAFAGVLGMDT